MSDQVRRSSLIDPVPAWEDTTVVGANSGLGCSSNSQLVVCSLWATQPAVVAYDALGARLWHSGALLNQDAYASAPLILTDGSTIAADTASVIRFGVDGAVMWNTATPGGLPISPVLTANGHVVLATRLGPLSTYDVTDGTLRDSLHIEDTIDSQRYSFSTANTPGVRENRIYALMEPDGGTLEIGRVYAVDVLADGTLQTAWWFEYRAPSGGSPPVVGDVVYFDGDGLSPHTAPDPHLFALRDAGAAPELVWAVPIPGRVLASPAHDPRGGVWIWIINRSQLYRHAEADGSVVQIADLGLLAGDPSVPGTVPPSVRIDRSGTTPGDLTVSWSATCSGGTDYAIYEGELGNWYGHAAIDCSDDGGDLQEEITPGSGNRYYLVVAQTPAAEGSYGTGARGAERPTGAGACRPAQESGRCDTRVISAMSVTDGPNGPVITLAATKAGTDWNVVAIDVGPEEPVLHWEFPLPYGATAPWGQYPVVIDPSGNPVVVFATNASGVRAIRDAP